MDIQQPFVTQEQKFKYWTESKSEIQSLRQQVAELKCSEEVLAHNVTSLHDQLALRDLEISKLRDALKNTEAYIAVTYGANVDFKYPLSTTFTPDHLNEWLKEQIAVNTNQKEI